MRDDKLPSAHASTVHPRPANWVILVTAQALWRRFHRDARSLPPAAWAQWRSALIRGFIMTALLAFGLTQAARLFHTQGLQAWDERMLMAIVSNAPLTFAQSITWESPGNLVGTVPAVLVSLVIAVKRSRPLIAGSLGAGYVLAFAFMWIGWGLWNRSRPTLVANGIAAPELHSFPSGHLMLVVIIYGFLTYLWLRASTSWFERCAGSLLLIVGVALVSTARLVLGSHWPSDILAGFALGVAWLSALINALRRAEAATKAV